MTDSTVKENVDNNTENQENSVQKQTEQPQIENNENDKPLIENNDKTVAQESEKEESKTESIDEPTDVVNNENEETFDAQTTESEVTADQKVTDTNADITATEDEKEANPTNTQTTEEEEVTDTNADITPTEDTKEAEPQPTNIEEEEQKTEEKQELSAEEVQRMERMSELSTFLEEAKHEAVDLRSHNYHLLKHVIDIVRQHNNTLGLDVTVPSAVSLLPATSNTETKQNELYENMLKEVEYLHNEYSTKQNNYNHKIVNLNENVLENDENAIQLKDTYKNFKRKICKNANKKPGNSTKIETKWIIQKEEEEEEIDVFIEQERLKNIHYTMNLKKLTQKIKEKDKLSDGLHLIDFEQLKIENQTLNEKIEERNDELYKLKKKITNTVQILTHIKEKLQFINKINHKLCEKQKHFDDEVNQNRDSLSELKKKRDLLRSKNTKLKQKQGFIANDVLVIDFQETKNNLKLDQEKLQQYKAKYAMLQQTVSLAETLKKRVTKQR